LKGLMAIPNLPRALVNVTAAKLRHGRTYWHGVAKAAQRAGRRLERQQEILRNAPALARRRLQRSKAALVRSRNRFERFDDHVLQPYRIERRVKRTLARGSGRRPIIVGPWTSEVGYEALYWVPFLHWALDHYRIDRQQVVAISRGGTQAWYEGIAARYVDVFDCMPPDEFAAELRARREQGDQKQMTTSALDRQLAALVADRVGLDDPVVWHQGLMYQLFRSFWYGDRSLQFFLRHADFHRARQALAEALRNPAGAARQARGVRLQPDLGSGGQALPALPSEYAAVKFYTGPSLPDTAANRQALRGYVERLAARVPVVMLDMPWSPDDHADYTFDGIRGVTTIAPALDPRTNLGVQTRVIAGARLFAGTCGGLAWLAPLLGVETIAVYDDDRFLTPHLYAARYAYRYSEAAAFSTLNIRALRGLSAIEALARD
jgi:hypothetical protein